MATAAPVILILGAGPNIGAAVGRIFGQNGYKVALAARRVTDGSSPDGSLNVQVDLSQPESVSKAFEKVTSALGPPGVVVYNAAAFTPAPATSPLDYASNLSAFTRDIAINTGSVLVAAHEAVKAFSALPSTAPRAFFFTGNILNSEPIPALLSLGIGKAATAHIIQTASKAYAAQGFRFYYADQRQADGAPMYSNISGEAHAQFFWDTVQRKETPEWWATFVAGQGYTKFADGPYLK